MKFVSLLMMSLITSTAAHADVDSILADMNQRHEMRQQQMDALYRDMDAARMRDTLNLEIERRRHEAEMQRLEYSPTYGVK